MPWCVPPTTWPVQRVSEASVHVDGELLGCIDQGLLVFVGIERKDTKAIAARLLERILGYRVFADDSGRMNLSVRDVEGGLLLVPQFTLVADTQKGARPSFSHAASPESWFGGGGRVWWRYAGIPVE